MIDATLIVQVKIFFFSILFGWVIGGACDLWKFIWKKIWNTPFITDMIFWIFTGIGLFVFTITENSGIIRGYLLVGWLLGWMLYWYLFRKQIRKIYIRKQGFLKKIKKTVKISIGRR